MNRTKRTYGLMVRNLICTLALMLPLLLLAQKAPRCTVKGGEMKIEIDRNISAAALDSFIAQFDLQHLKLPTLLFENDAFAVKEAGWHIEIMTEEGFILSKKLEAAEGLNKPEGRMQLAQYRPTFAERFPATGNGLTFGHNRFRNKHPFVTGKDSVVTFFIRGYQKADKVMLAGSFNNWDPDALSMQRTDSGWIAGVKLKPGKYWYKFIVDGKWMVDSDNQNKENDGEGNINSIFYRTNTVFFLPGYENAKNVSLAGSFNQWRPRDLAMQRTNGGWILPLYLSEGTHVYKFVVDGKWIADANNPNRMPDGYGDYNSYIAMGREHLFRLNGYAHAKDVRVAGSFNNWRHFELPMRKTNDGWELPYVLADGNYEYKFWVDGKWIADPERQPVRGENSSMVIGANHTMHLKGYETAKQVFIAGDFNSWNPDSFPMQRDGDGWSIPLYLWTGKHRYKFIVDGKWILDPDNKLWEQNEHRTGNSVLWIGNKNAN